MQDSKNSLVKSDKENVSNFMEQGMMSSLIESILPKVLPLLNPALEKFSEYLGEDSKTIVIRKRKDKPPLVLIFDNSKEFNINGSGVKGSDDSLINMFDIKQFIEKLIAGEIAL